MNDTSATLVPHERYECDTSENNFSYPYISYMAIERLQGEKKFHSKNYLLEMPHSHTKMRLNVSPQKLNFIKAKVISKRHTLDCSCKRPCMFPHSYA